jgi:hypothetical protein
MPAIDTRFFWERDFSIDEGFNFERGQSANYRFHIHVLETIDPRWTEEVRSAQAETAGNQWNVLISRRRHRAQAAL